MLLSRAFAPFLLLLAAVTTAASAQTYTPRQIRIDAPAGTDTAEPLRIAALKPGVPLTKPDIEAALQRIVDTGLFSAIAYTVDSDALVIKLTPSASSQAQPVHFANFVWWQPGELEPLLEARVPLYRGQLPLSGNLTEQVEAALVAMLKEKGIDAAVSDRETGEHVDSVTLNLTRPPVVIANINLPGDLSALQPQTAKVIHRLRGQDFDLDESARAIADSVDDLYRNAGYLDVATAAATYSAPRKDLNDYTVDLTAAVTPNAPYRVAKITIHATSPVSQSELETAAEIHPNDPASPLALRIAHGEMEKAYSLHGYFDAKATIVTTKDATAHTVAYDVTLAPGEVYRLATLDASALPADQQAAIAANLHLTPGTVADQALTGSVARTLNDLHILRTITPSIKMDRANHTVTIVLKPAPTLHN